MDFEILQQEGWKLVWHHEQCSWRVLEVEQVVERINCLAELDLSPVCSPEA